MPPSNERNPYAPPKAEVWEVRDADCARDGKLVVVKVGSDLPQRCILCNAPARLPIKTKKIYWHSSWIYLLILINVVLYVIVGLIARKSFRVSAGLCELHEAQRRRRVLLLAGGGLAATAIGAISLSYDQGVIAALLWLAGLVAFIAARLAARRVYARKITKQHAVLAGCKEAFLASLGRPMA